MATSGRAILQAHVDGLLPESIPIDIQWTLTGVLEILPLTLASGDNTLTVPTGTDLIILIPPVTNAAAIKWKGLAGDTGLTGPPNAPNIITWSVGTVIVNAASSIAGVTLIFLG